MEWDLVFPFTTRFDKECTTGLQIKKDTKGWEVCGMLEFEINALL